MDYMLLYVPGTNVVIITNFITQDLEFETPFAHHWYYLVKHPELNVLYCFSQSEVRKRFD